MAFQSDHEQTNQEAGSPSEGVSRDKNGNAMVMKMLQQMNSKCYNIFLVFGIVPSPVKNVLYSQKRIAAIQKNCSE